MADVAGHDEFEELAAGHALHALEPADEHAFLTHMETCADCRRSLAEFSELAAGLAISSAEEPAQEPPPQLWNSIHQHVLDDDHEQANDGIAASVGAARPRRTSRRNWLSAAAAAVVVAAGVTGWQLSSGGHGSHDTVQTALANCRHSAGCRVVQLTNSQNVRETAYLMISGQDVQVATETLPAIDTSRQTYVLWQMPQDGRPTGVVAFAVSSSHSATVAHGTLPQTYDSTTAFAISREAGTTIPAQPGILVAIGAATSA